MKPKINVITLAVNDLEKSEAFYIEPKNGEIYGDFSYSYHQAAQVQEVSQA